MDRRQRLALLGVAAVIAAVVAIIAVGSGGDDNKSGTTASTTQATQPGDTTQQQQETTTTTETAPAPPEPVVEKIEIKGGQPVGGAKKISVKKGEQVQIDVTSDTAGEAHLHGYDIEKELQPGKTAKFGFKADIEGVFELELHPSTQLAQITVEP